MIVRFHRHPRSFFSCESQESEDDLVDLLAAELGLDFVSPADRNISIDPFVSESIADPHGENFVDLLAAELGLDPVPPVASVNISIDPFVSERTDAHVSTDSLHVDGSSLPYLQGPSDELLHDEWTIGDNLDFFGDCFE